MKNPKQILALLTVTVFHLIHAQEPLSEKATWPIDIINNYRVVPNVTYSVASGYECKLDVYARRTATPSVPTVVYIHGGGWIAGTKEAGVMSILPYLEMGFAAVNVEYRLAKKSAIQLTLGYRPPATAFVSGTSAGTIAGRTSTIPRGRSPPAGSQSR